MPDDKPKRLRPNAFSGVPTDPETPRRLADLVAALSTPTARASKTKVIELAVKELWERESGKRKRKAKGEGE